MNTSRFVFLAATFAAFWMVQPVVVQAQVSGPPPKDRHMQVDAIFAPWQGTSTPGCAVGIARNGAVDYIRGYGMSNLEYDVAITPESIFHVASISKQFTAFSIRLLAQDGKISLNDDVRKYVPELPYYEQKITISHLIYHTSGLREQGQLLYLAGWRSDDLMTEEDILDVVTKQRGVNFPAGAEALYSNIGYTLLAIIVKRVSGKPLRAFADERIFKPLGMLDTHFHNDHTEIVRRRTSAYRPREEGGWRINVPMFDHYGSTSLFSTVSDLLKWEENFVHARVGGRALVEAMQKSGTLANGKATGYASGLRTGTYRGLRTIGHDGADAGYRSELLTFPGQRLSIVALCNGATIAPGELVRKVANVYLSERLTLSAITATKIPEAELSALSGAYWSSLSDEVVRLEVREGSLYQTGSSTVLLPFGNGLFRPAESTHEWLFVGPATSEKTPLELRITDFWPTARTFLRVTAPLPSFSQLASLVGRYRSSEVDTTFAVRLDNGKLSLAWPRQMNVALEPIGGDRFVGTLGTVTFTRRSSGEVDGMTLSNRRLRRLRAERLEMTETSLGASGVQN